MPTHKPFAATRAGTPERRVRREAYVEAILALVPVLPLDLRVARTHALLWAQLAAAGQIIGAHDLLIAATALTHGYTVLTQNLREFGRVPGLVVLQPHGKFGLRVASMSPAPPAAPGTRRT